MLVGTKTPPQMHTLMVHYGQTRGHKSSKHRPREWHGLLGTADSVTTRRLKHARCSTFDTRGRSLPFGHKGAASWETGNDSWHVILSSSAQVQRTATTDACMRIDNEEWIDAGQPLCMHLPFILGLPGLILSRPPQTPTRCYVNRNQMRTKRDNEDMPPLGLLSSSQASLGLATTPEGFALPLICFYLPLSRILCKQALIIFAYFRKPQTQAQSAHVPRPGKGGSGMSFSARHIIRGVARRSAMHAIRLSDVDPAPMTGQAPVDQTQTGQFSLGLLSCLCSVWNTSPFSPTF